MRSQAWVIVERRSTSEDEENQFDVLHGRNSVSTGMRSITNARMVVASARTEGERVWHEDASDGYRTELTKTFPAPQTASGGTGSRSGFWDPERPARSRYLARYGRSSRPGKWL